MRMRQVTLLLVLGLGGLAAAQDAPAPAPAPAPPPPAAPPAQPPPAPAKPAAPGPANAPGGPAVPNAPMPRGGGVVDIGPTGPPTRVPELLARTPDVARASTLLGVDILDMARQRVARLDDFVARPDGRLVAILTREDGRVLALPLDELIARAKPDPTRVEHATIKNFKLAPLSRRLDAAPEIEDKATLNEAWLTRLDEGAAGPRIRSGDEAEAGEEGAEGGDAPQATAVEPDPNTLPLLSSLFGKPALDPSGEPIGTLVDVIVGMHKASIAYLVVAQPDLADGPDSLHAVPYATLVQVHAGEGVRLSIGGPELAAAPRIEGLGKLPVDPLATAEDDAATAPPPR